LQKNSEKSNTCRVVESSDSDLVIMSAYAPLFVNVNPGGMQWKTEGIGYNTLSSYGSPAYWEQQMFSRNHGKRSPGPPIPFALHFRSCA
jgi:hypothetical protein